MAVKKCCVENCNSSSTRKEDVGVTYHKFPKDKTICAIWIKATCEKPNTDLPMYVCSRHFCKSDFRIYKDSKYVLKSDAVPSIFSWSTADTEVSITMEKEKCTEDSTNDSKKDTPSGRKVSEGENVDAIKKFIEDQEKEISDRKSNTPVIEAIEAVEKSTGSHELSSKETSKSNEASVKAELEDETMIVASSVMDMILSESEAKIAKNKVEKSLASASPGAKGSSTMSLSVGSKVEAKDYGDFWYPAQIVEVDYDDMEVLVHYKDESKKHDEWINVSSPRLRPIGSSPSVKSPTLQHTSALGETKTDTDASVVQVKGETKPEEKAKLTFVVGERCLARWRDNRRFIATITEDLGNGKYEITFDDGVRWTCNTSRLYKLKEPACKDPLSVDTSLPLSTSASSPVYGPGPSNSGVALTAPCPLPAYHTHLFDPTRDYLGSKSERREKKRKLNIKEIFNIGQKKKKIETPPKIKTPKIIKEKKPRVIKVIQNKIKLEPECEVITAPVKQEIPDAVASIIGTVSKDKEINEIIDIKEEPDQNDSKMDLDETLEVANSETLSAPESQDLKLDDDPVLEEEIKLEKFDHVDDVTHGKVMDRMKVVITKLEDGLNQVENKVEKVDSPKIEVKEEIKTVENVLEPVVSDTKTAEVNNQEKPQKNLSKIKKSKKSRVSHERKVKKQVEKVKSELEEMKKQVEEMRKQMLQKTEELAKSKQNPEMPESFLLPGEWCCRWLNGQPVGTVSELESEVKFDANNKPALPRRSVQVEDKRLPEGWTKHMVRRSFGHSAGKWDVVLVSPDNRRFHTKTDMRNYLENNSDVALKPYEGALMDFGVHLKLSRRMGWYATTPDGQSDTPVVPLPAGTLSSTSPLVKRTSLSLKRNPKKIKDKRKPLCLKLKVPRKYRYKSFRKVPSDEAASTSAQTRFAPAPPLADVPLNSAPLEDGYVYVGSLKVQIIENLLRCPAEGCFKNFRNNTLLKMHIKHYHRDLRKQLGATPKVLDLASARTKPTEMQMRRLKLEAEHKTIKVKLPRLPKRFTEPKSEPKGVAEEMLVDAPTTPVTVEGENVPRSQDSPKLRNALIKRPVKRPRVLLPVRRPPEEISLPEPANEETIDFEELVPDDPMVQVPNLEPLDFETAISTHTVTKPIDVLRMGDKKRKSFASVSKLPVSEDEEWFAMNNSDVETRSSYPRSGTPDSKILDQKLVSSESNEEPKDINMYTFTETGERIKIVHMKREEIINCHCGFREEDGLMVQCELCLCWQHALCHNIQREAEVPEKYTCSICLNPRRGRRSQRFLHDQDRLYEGLLPGAKPCESLRRSHELSGNLLRIEDALHALRVKYYVATKKDHPKLYLWAKDWETGEINLIQDKLNSDYSDLNIMISSVGKENLPIRDEAPLHVRTPPSEEHDADRFCQRDGQLGSQALLSGLLSSPGGASLDLPISTSELERLASTVQEQESQRVGVTAPQPEAAIENSACRERLLRHIQRCQALIDARLDSIEAQVAELESQDPSFEDDETAEYFPRTKQTVQMLMRDLDTMEELGVIT